MTPIRLVTFWPLWLGVVLTLISNLLALTPIVWHLSGAPSEFYPELFFLTFFVPISVFLLIVGAIHAAIVIKRLGGVRRQDELRD